MGNSFETITVLQYRLKAAQEELAAFQSGEKYIRMEKQHLTQVRALERRIAKLEAAVAKNTAMPLRFGINGLRFLNSCKRMRPYGRRSSKKADMMEKGPSVQKNSATSPLKSNFPETGTLQSKDRA